MVKLLDKTLRLFLDSIGRREEYEFYLEKFQVGADAAFALVVPERAGLEESAALFAFDLQFLRRLGLDPVVLLCGADAALQSAIVQTEDHPYLVREVHLAALLRGQGLAGLLAEAEAAGRVLVLVDSDVTLEEGVFHLVPALTKRVHVIRARGPLHDAGGAPLSFYQVQDPVPLHPEDEALAALCGRVVFQHAGVHVSVASPLNLLEELFTVKGAGCLIRRGVRVEAYTRIEQVDRARMIELLEASFGKRVLDTGFLARAGCMLLDPDYQCTAILERGDPYTYISKFAVHPAARGEGVAQELWRAVTERCQSLYWRASLGNPIHQWYARQADGVHRENGWNVYWRGIARTDIPAVIADAVSRPVDLG